MTIMIYSLVNLGAMLRVFGNYTEFRVLVLQHYNVFQKSILELARKKALAGSHSARV